MDAFFTGGPYEYTPGQITLTADAYYDSETQSTDDISTGFSISGVGATPGVTSIPSSGVHLLPRNDGAPYKYNHAMFHAEVFDFADL